MGTGVASSLDKLETYFVSDIFLHQAVIPHYHSIQRSSLLSLSVMVEKKDPRGYNTQGIGYAKRFGEAMRPYLLK